MAGKSPRVGCDSVVRNYDVGTSHPDLFTLGAFLQDVEGYASPYLLIFIETSFGNVTTLLKYDWVIQLYQALNYPRYYQRELTTGGNFPQAVLQRQHLTITTEYDYNSPSFFTKGICRRNLNGAITDIYVANDLKESAPMSTPQQVKDYTVSQFDAEFAALGDLDWVNVGSVTSLSGSSYEDRISHYNGPDRVEYNNSAYIVRYRYKVYQEFRADDTRYDADQYTNYYYTGNTDPYQDFGTGKVEDAVEFVQLTADVNDNFVLEIPNPDYSNAGTGVPPAVPALGVPLVTGGGGIFKRIIAAITSGQSTPGTLQAVYVRPNKTDGTGFEYYTP